jgi:glycosyltransferase involved in cell wall biosynthesis
LAVVGGLGGIVTRVVFYPSIEQIAINPYWSGLRAGLEARGVEFVDPNAPTFSARWLWTMRGNVDVLHFHFCQQAYAYESIHARLRWVLRYARNLLLARGLGYKTVYTLHDLEPAWPLQPRWIDYLGHWVTANLTGGVIVHSETARQSLAQRYGRRRNVHIIHHPNFIGHYPDDATRAQARQRLGLSADHIVFAFIGGIRPNKGIERLISAVQEINDDRFRLLIAGRPWEPTAYINNLAMLAQLDARIQFTPRWIPDEDMQLYYKAADVIVMPFASVLTSSSTILAMSFGKPVVVPAMGSLVDLVTRDVGLTYDPEDPGALRRALILSRSVDLDEMGQAGRRKVEGDTWESFVSKTLAVYHGPDAVARRGEHAIPVPSAGKLGTRA